MVSHFLIVDSETKRFDMYFEAFAKRGVMLEKVSSMLEALEQYNKKPYTSVSINADTIDFSSQLQILCDAVYAPIHIFTSELNDVDELNAFRLGADMYSAWRDEPEKQATFSILYCERHIQRIKEPIPPVQFINYKCLRIYPDYRKAIIEDKELHLKRKEYDILLILATNSGKPFAYEHIYRRVWKAEYGDDCYDAILSQVQRLRKKLYTNPKLLGCIENVREFGYRLTPG